MKYESDEMQIDLRELLYAIRRRIVVILLVGVLFGGVTAAYTTIVTEPVYESTSRLYIQTQSTSITSLADIQVGSSLALDYVELIQSRTLCEEVIDNLGLQMDYKELQRCLTVVNPEDTRILNISIQGTNRKNITAIANEFALVAQKNISEIMKTDEPSVWERAVKPDKPIKPEKTKCTVIGFLIGILLSMFVVIVLHMMDDKLKTPDDIEHYLGLNTLASVPFDGDKKKSKSKQKSKSKKKRSKRGK